MVVAQAAGGHADFVRKVLQLFQRQQRAGLASLIHRIERRAIGAHQPGDIRAHDVYAELLFKDAQDRVVQERAALDNNIFPQFLRGRSTDDLINRILYNADRQAGGNIFGCRAVFLRLFDRRVHKHGAAGTQLACMLGKQPELCTVLDAISQCVSKGL